MTTSSLANLHQAHHLLLLHQDFGPSLAALSRPGKLLVAICLSKSSELAFCLTFLDLLSRKENVQKASVWTGQRLGQKSTLVQPSIPVLDIPVDEDIHGQPSPEHPHAVPKVTHSIFCVSC